MLMTYSDSASQAYDANFTSAVKKKSNRIATKKNITSELPEAFYRILHDGIKSTWNGFPPCNGQDRFVTIPEKSNLWHLYRKSELVDVVSEFGDAEFEPVFDPKDSFKVHTARNHCRLICLLPSPDEFCSWYANTKVILVITNTTSNESVRLNRKNPFKLEFNYYENPRVISNALKIRSLRTKVSCQIGSNRAVAG